MLYGLTLLLSNFFSEVALVGFPQQLSDCVVLVGFPQQKLLL